MPTDRSTRLPAPASSELQALLLPEHLPPTAAIDVAVSIDDRDLNLRDLSRFLLLIDRSYGRLVKGDLRSYAWDERSQIRVSQMRHGSWEVVLTQVLSVIPDPTSILVIYALLKLLPKAVEHTATSVEKLATAYNSYEQGRLARENRRKLRAEIDSDEELSALPTKRKSQVAEIIDVLIRDDPSISNPAQRFAERSLRRVRIKVRSESDD